MGPRLVLRRRQARPPSRLQRPRRWSRAGCPPAGLEPARGWAGWCGGSWQLCWACPCWGLDARSAIVNLGSAEPYLGPLAVAQAGAASLLRTRGGAALSRTLARWLPRGLVPPLSPPSQGWAGGESSSGKPSVLFHGVRLYQPIDFGARFGYNGYARTLRPHPSWEARGRPWNSLPKCAQNNRLGPACARGVHVAAQSQPNPNGL